MQKRAYITPKVTSEAVSIGVFGCYGGTGGNGYTKGFTWGSWWKLPKKRRWWWW